jgi:hypothetical protein
MLRMILKLIVDIEEMVDLNARSMKKTYLSTFCLAFVLKYKLKNTKNSFMLRLE